MIFRSFVIWRVLLIPLVFKWLCLERSKIKADPEELIYYGIINNTITVLYKDVVKSFSCIFLFQNKLPAESEEKIVACLLRGNAGHDRCILPLPCERESRIDPLRW